jgi:hypothetical protein
VITIGEIKLSKAFKTFLVLSVCLLSFGMTVFSQQNVEVELTGAFAEIDVKQSNEAIKVLKCNDNAKKRKTVKAILETPNDYNPIVFYVLSNELFEEGKKKEGCFWFYVGQLRARMDANICADVSARQIVSLLNDEYGQIINEYAIPKINFLEETIRRVIDFVKNNNENYDRRWINLFGMWAFKSNTGQNLELSLSKEQWANIKEKTINDYYEGFKEFKAGNLGSYKVIDINIYKNTSVWELALAVKDQKTGTIEKIFKAKLNLINYQESKYGATLLLWAVGTERYKSAESLLKCGADPNIASTSVGETPLYVASGYSWVDNDAKEDPKYVKLLLRYGANPNINYIGSDIPGKKSVTEPGTSPLMHSIRCGIEKTKALVEAGADINYKTESGDTAAITALGAGGPNATLEGMEYAYYLIVEKKAKVNEPYYRGKHMTMPGQNPNDKFYPVDILRNWVYDINSKEYKIKMEIVKEFARQGVNYWDTKIPKFTLEYIKKRYPDTWEEYIKKY